MTVSRGVCDGVADGVLGTRLGFSAVMLELGEELLDGVHVRRVFRQEEELGAGLANGRSHGLALMRTFTLLGRQICPCDIYLPGQRLWFELQQSIVQNKLGRSRDTDLLCKLLIFADVFHA